MVILNLFENSIKNQAIRTVISLLIIIAIDCLWVFLSNAEKFINTWNNPIMNNFLAYFNVWITIAIVFGVSTLTRIKNEEQTEINHESIKDYIYYGLLIGLLVYVPLYNWLLSCRLGNSPNTYITSGEALGNTAFGVVLCAAVCLLTFLISAKLNLFED